MQTFAFTRASNVAEAIAAAASPDARFIAGGTTLLDLMKLDVERPQTLIDINHLALGTIVRLADGSLEIGALVRNADLARDPVVERDYPVLSQALLAGASAQLRNMATTGGNLLQRTRCMYFRDDAMPCNKRNPGSGCPAIAGENRNLAIVGTSDACIATNPSDMNVALSALGATIRVRGPHGERTVPIDDFFLLPGETPQRENVLGAGDLVTAVVLPPLQRHTKQVYLKLRDRASYEFALASAAVVAAIEGGKFIDVRIALGGVGTKPWRSREAEDVLRDGGTDGATFRRAARAALRDAQPQTQNGFKVELARRCIVHALDLATAST